jgi:tRNA(Ile)-lysidine synthase
VAEALVRLGALAAASSRAVEGRLLELEDEVTRSANHDLVELRRDRLLQFPVFLRAELLRRAWRRAGWPEAGMSAKRWRRLAALAGSRRIDRMAIGGNIELTTAGGSGCPADGFILRHIEAVAAGQDGSALPEGLPLEVPGCVPWNAGKITTAVEPDAPRDETIDLDRIASPLRVRAPVPGDRFAPLGMGGRSTPLNDFFRGRRVPPAQRACTPLLCDEAGIVWVVGHRIADRVKVTENTQRTLGLRWEPDGANPVAR